MLSDWTAAKASTEGTQGANPSVFMFCFTKILLCFVSFHKKIYEHPEETVSFLDKFCLYLQEPEDKSILEY